MPDASLLTPEDRFIGLFIGRTGSGKKAAACSFPHPIKYLDFDGRIRGLLGTPWVERKGIDYTYYPPKLQNTTVFNKLNDDLQAMLIQSTTGQFPYKTVVISSLTGEALTFLGESTVLTHTGTKGKKIGVLNMPDPNDYGYQSQAMQQVLSFFRSVPGINFIVTGHMVDRFGTPPGSNDPYAEKVKIGEELNLTKKLSETLPAFFDNIVRFSKTDVNGMVRHYATFRSDMARTTYNELPNGDVEITGKNFYNYLMSKIVKKEEAEKT